MKQERLLALLEGFCLTEKANAERGLYVLRVHAAATKPEIRAAVELAFGVVVKDVRVLNMKPKATRFRQMKGRHQGWKKAYVTLAEKQQIEIATEAA
ncbi:MAG: 50S ribosomal protein L23 [Gammaproteobacteria bacterium RIFCSPHIGHO2_12_FULL_45_9]|nr:MAG: 50S ribosomal protein L23 [Gammaproteobacteria bacterium RIFCSPHIGHO2_12_FULL_45_9]